MEFTAKQVAQFIQGSIEGDENVTINTFAKIEEEEEEILLLIQEKKKEFTNETNHILLGTVTESEISDRNEMMKQSLLQYTMAGIRNRYADANGFDPDAMFEEMKEHILFLNQLFYYTRSEKGAFL